MRTFPVLVVLVVLGTAVSACSGGDEDAASKPTPSMTEITVSCARYAGTAKKIADAQTALYAGTGGAAAIRTLTSELDALKDGAPADVRAALTDLAGAFAAARVVLENPTTDNKAKLAELAPRLSADGQKITAYVTSKCG